MDWKKHKAWQAARITNNIICGDMSVSDHEVLLMCMREQFRNDGTYAKAVKELGLGQEAFEEVFLNWVEDGRFIVEMLEEQCPCCKVLFKYHPTEKGRKVIRGSKE